MHMAVLCEVAQFIFVDSAQSVEGDRPDDGGGKLLRTVDRYLPNYKAQYDTRQPSSSRTVQYSY
jgi:hypothetical protein